MLKELTYTTTNVLNHAHQELLKTTLKTFVNHVTLPVKNVVVLPSTNVFLVQPQLTYTTTNVLSHVQIAPTQKTLIELVDHVTKLVLLVMMKT